VDAVDPKERTALTFAATYGSTDCINVLASYNANVLHMDDEGHTPLHYAEQSQRPEALQALVKLQTKLRMQERRRHKAARQQVGGWPARAAAASLRC
jgi:ankyrin repeat protein